MYISVHSCTRVLVCLTYGCILPSTSTVYKNVHSTMYLVHRYLCTIRYHVPMYKYEVPRTSTSYLLPTSYVLQVCTMYEYYVRASTCLRVSVYLYRYTAHVCTVYKYIHVQCTYVHMYIGTSTAVLHVVFVCSCLGNASYK